MFNLRMLTSSFISLVFCSNKRMFFDLKNVSRLKRTLSIVLSASVSTGLEITEVAVY